MQIEKHNNLVKLFDIYGKLLSNRQFEVMDKVLNFDLGVSELAQLDGESRQSVHDAINKAKKQLYGFEEKCKILENYEKISNELKDIKTKLENNDTKELSHQIDAVIDKLN